MKSINYVDLQIVKKRVKRRLKTVSKLWVKGSDKDFPSGTQNTSYIERFNLTLRQRISYLHRKTLGYCKNKTNLNRTLWINLFDYNYCQFHKSLRLDLTEQKIKFKKRYKEVTPAMKIGLTSSQLSWRFLLVSPVPKSNWWRHLHSYCLVDWQKYLKPLSCMLFIIYPVSAISFAASRSETAECY